MSISSFSHKFHDAFAYAAQLHALQYRKGTKIPYVTHLLSVAALVGESGGTETELIAALLHDAVEDQGGQKTLEEIQIRFGMEVAEIVSACSDTDILPKPPWKERKLNYIKHLSNCQNQSVLLVSSADKLHNFRSITADYREIGDNVWERFSAPKEEILWYYRELTKIYKAKSCPPRLWLELQELILRFAE